MIGRPENDEIEEALAAAMDMRATGEDVHHVTRLLSYLYQRCESLEQLLEVTDRYLRFGMPEAELSKMRRLVDALRQEEPLERRAGRTERTLPL